MRSDLIARRLPMADGHWHFHCPECGMGDFELGRLAADQEFFCEVCVEEGRGLIRLERCPADNELPVYARFRLGLAA
jgi:hypothetical protein